MKPLTKLSGAVLGAWMVIACGARQSGEGAQNAKVSLEALAAAPSSPCRVAGPGWLGHESREPESVEGEVGAIQGQADLQEGTGLRPALLEALLDRNVFQGFAVLLLASEIEAELAEEPFTVFVPNDMAFQFLSAEQRLELMEFADEDLLAEIVRRHVVRGALSADDVAKAGELSTLAGTRIRIESLGGLPVMNGAQLLSSQAVQGGIFHEIDRMLMP